MSSPSRCAPCLLPPRCTLPQIGAKYTFQVCTLPATSTVYFTPDWGKEFVQQFLEYTRATDVAGLPLSVFNQNELLERTFKVMGLTKVQKRIVSQVLTEYPEFAQTWNITLPKQATMQLLGYTNVRNLRDVLENLIAKDIHMHLIEER